MPDDNLLNRFPDLFFKRLKEQMLLGLIPSETVEEILDPLLRNYSEVRPLLPRGLRRDIENILKIYPEIAERLGPAATPSIAAALASLIERFRKEFAFTRRPRARIADLAVEPGPDALAAEEQALYDAAPHGFIRSAESCFMSGTVESRSLEYSFDEGSKQLRFESPGASQKVEVFINGRRALSLEPQPDMRTAVGRLDLERFLALFEDEALPEIEVEVRESDD